VFNHAAIGKIGRLLVPRAFGSALYHINVFVDTILASFERIVGAGGQSALYYSNRLFQLPLAIFGVAMAQALLPTFSAQMAREDMKGFKETFSFAIRSLMGVVLPASVGLIVLSGPIVRIIFERGKFDAHSTAITSSALYFYGFGLLSCCFIKIFVNAFYAMHDTKTPVKITFVSLALNIVFCLILMRPLKIGGLALASSLSATANMALLYLALRKRVGELDEARIATAFLKMAFAAVLMGFAALAYNEFVLEAQFASRRLVQAACLLGGILLSILFYLGLAFLLKIEETRALFSWRPRSPRT
ncbi:MAG: murein biosynthesis integral membrane protein MurJ, partial [Candidatus Omnitrophota bacterium]